MRRHNTIMAGTLTALALSGCQSTPAPTPAPATEERPERRPEAPYNPFAPQPEGQALTPSGSDAPRPTPGAPSPAPGAPSPVVVDNGYRPVIPGPSQVPVQNGYDHTRGPIPYMVEGPKDAQGNERDGLDRLGVFGYNALLDNSLSAVPVVRLLVDRGHVHGRESYLDDFWGRNHNGTPRKAPIGLTDYIVAIPRIGATYHMRSLGEWLRYQARAAFECENEEECQRRQRE